MGKRAIRLVLVALVMALPLWGMELGSGAGNHGGRRPAYAPGELLVKYKAALGAAAADHARHRWGVSTLRTFHDIGVHHVKLAADMTVEEALEIYRGDPEVEYVEPNYYRHVTATPDDTDYGVLWGLNNTGQTICPPDGTVCPPYPLCVTGTSGADIDAATAWDTATDCTNVTVAIIDTGADYNHPDLAANIAAGGHDFVDNDDQPIDPNGHGTHVAGTIAAVGNNSRGVTGICWNANLLILRAFDALGSATLSDIISAMEYARTKNANVINASYTGGDFSQAESDEISTLNNAGILFIAAAGNESTDNDATPSYPASYNLPNIIAVAASDQNDELACFSNYGANSVHVAAPGTNIYSTKPGRQTVFSDNFDDNDISDWTVDPHWALSTDADSAPYALALVPGDAEGKGVDLIARPTNAVGLTGQIGTLLGFTLKGTISGGDLLFVETSTDGNTWTNRPVLVSHQDLFENGVSGSAASWVGASVDLGSLDGAPAVYFRFRFHTQNTTSSKGDNGNGKGCFIASAAYGSPLSLGAAQAAATASVVHIDDVQITAAGVEDAYQYLSGTSMATPHVVGLAALVWSHTPGLTHLQVKERILNCVDRLSSLSLKVFTQGRINAANSIQAVPAPPVGLSATRVSGTQVNLTWANTYFGQIGFSIERKDGSGSYTEIANLTTNTTSYPDTPVPGGTHSYRMRAYIGSTFSIYTGVVSVTTP
ncbi:MAG TPA: S8 family serine peptidase [Syntrophobacteria bacterium]|nr:S8 family serine peptidase [Syntrophobacteria bacterium]